MANNHFFYLNRQRHPYRHTCNHNGEEDEGLIDRPAGGRYGAASLQVEEERQEAVSRTHAARCGSDTSPPPSPPPVSTPAPPWLWPPPAPRPFLASPPPRPQPASSPCRPTPGHRKEGPRRDGHRARCFLP